MKIITVLIATVLCGSPASAGTFTVFGPQIYTRAQGQPTTVTRTFQVANGSDPFTLVVNNQGVINGTISINGQPVLDTLDFNAQRTGSITRAISVHSGANEIAVTLIAPVKASLTIQLTGVENVAPLITASTDPQPNAAGWNNSTVVVSFVCSDADSGLASCSAPVTVSAEGAKRVVTGTATDKAGNVGTASVTVNLDKTAPAVTSTLSPTPNAAGWNNTPVAVTFSAADALSGVVQGSITSPVTLSQDGANQSATGQASDLAGNVGTVTRTGIRIDRTVPTVQFTSPSDNSFTPASSIAVQGSISDSGSSIASVTCDGAAATLNSVNFECTVNLQAGANEIVVFATDVADNVGRGALHVTEQPASSPHITLTEPANLSFLNTSPVTVRGTVSDPSATVTVNGIAAPATSGAFVLSLPLIEGNNTITAVAAVNGVTSTASSQVTLDTTPPRVTILSPPNGFVTTDAKITVAGNANDTVVGTVNDQQVQVTVNGRDALVKNRSFQALDVDLALGDNLITSTGRDRAGNGATTTISVRRDSPTQPHVQLVSGNNQSGQVGSRVPAPLVVGLLNGTGNPVPNQTVVFTVTQNNGSLGGGLTTEAVTTNAGGQAQVPWTLGTRSGAGNNTVIATANGFAGSAVFTASGNASSASLINMDAGTAQTGVAGQPLAHPFVAVAQDSSHNRLPNVSVTFQVQQGGGSFNGQGSFTTMTDNDGRALATLTLGPSDGITNNVVEATFLGNSGFPASFVASGRAAGDPSATRISGVVLDNSNNPVPGVTLRAYLTNVPAQVSQGVPPFVTVKSDAQGQFEIQPAPVGFVKLIADGSTAQRPGQWPNLEYDLVTVAGQNNTIGMPIYLLPLDTAHQVCVSETTGGTLTLPDMPGFSMSVQAGAATFPGGSKSGCFSVTPVHPDKIPMVPGFGQQPRFIVTIQPAGTLFNPPASITIPNLEGLKPHEMAEMYSFDHDLGTFVSVGTGTVGDDGTAIRSDPGVGVLKAGWYSSGNSVPAGTAGVCPECQTCQGSACVADPAQSGQTCSTGTCQNGLCLPGLKIIVPLTTPSGQNSFIATRGQDVGDNIVAKVQPIPGGLDTQVNWSVSPVDANTGSAQPSQTQATNTFTFVGNSQLSTTGSRSPNPPVAYKVKATLMVSGLLLSDAAQAVQDEADRERQEYVDYGTAFRPARDNITAPTIPQFNTGNYSVIAEETPGTLQSLFENLKLSVNSLLNNAVQSIPVGTPNLPATAGVVSPGAVLTNVGTILNTKPEGDDECSVQLSDGYCIGTVLAGRNGVAETHANNSGEILNLTGAEVTSAYRNPQRNRAVGSVLINSFHTRGRAFDIDPRGLPIAGKTSTQKMCLFEIAGQKVAEAFAEQGPVPVPCTATGADHVHLEK